MATKIDISAVKKFQDMWSPIMETIPAVLDMAEHQADLARGIATEEKRLKKVQDDIAAKTGEGEALVAKLNAEIELLAEKRNKAAAAYEAQKAEIAGGVSDAKKASAAEIELIEQKVALVLGKIEEAEKAYAAKVAVQEADYAERVQQLEAEIKGIEARKKAAEKTLDTLRAKLG